MKREYLHFALGDEPGFPFVKEDIAGEFVAHGGKLEPEWIIEAYSHGFFPYYAFKHEGLRWSCPTDRFVIFPEKIHVSHSMRTLMNGGRYQVSFDEAFEDVIANCSELRIDDNWAWLGPDIVKAYTDLHERGIAHSVEVWEGDKLVGGLYGLFLLGAFFGESMFSLVPSASKLALIELARRGQRDGWSMIDCQYETGHLLTMGGKHIPYGDYINKLGWIPVSQK